MTDRQFDILLSQTYRGLHYYKSKLEEAEEEFERRYGKNPSDIDFDTWIDVFHIGGSSLLTAEEIETIMGAER